MSLIWRHFRAYGKRRWGYAAFCVGISAAFNLYFLFFIQGGKTEYLLYLDVLVLCFFMLWGAVDFWRFAGEKKNLEKLLGQKGLWNRQQSLGAREHVILLIRKGIWWK